MNKLFWYSQTDNALIDFEPTEFELDSIMSANGVDEGMALAIRLESLRAIPVIPVWTYGTLMEDQSNHKLMTRVALPEFKPIREMVDGVEIYVSKNVHFPAAILTEGKSTYMERYLVRPSDIELLDQYEGAPDLYQLKELPNGEGYFYCWNKGLKEWDPLPSGDWRDK